MTREIKFRAWDSAKSRMWQGFDLHEDGFDYPPSIVEPPRRKLIFMQYTGLKDKNGVEIYEGDVIRNPDGTGPVVWFTDGWTIEGLSDRTFSMRQALLWHGTPQLEVIGNIYENPELIQK